MKNETLREASNSRKITRDIGSDGSILEIIDDFGLVRDLNHDLEIGSIAREWWSIHPDDPLSAEAKLTGQKREVAEQENTQKHMPR